MQADWQIISRRPNKSLGSHRSPHLLCAEQFAYTLRERGANWTRISDRGEPDSVAWAGSPGAAKRSHFVWLLSLQSGLLSSADRLSNKARIHWRILLGTLRPSAGGTGRTRSSLCADNVSPAVHRLVLSLIPLCGACAGSGEVQKSGLAALLRDTALIPDPVATPVLCVSLRSVSTTMEAGAEKMVCLPGFGPELSGVFPTSCWDLSTAASLAWLLISVSLYWGQHCSLIPCNAAYFAQISGCLCSCLWTKFSECVDSTLVLKCRLF